MHMQGQEFLLEHATLSTWYTTFLRKTASLSMVKNVNLARMHKEFNIAYFLPLWVTEEPKLVLYDAPTETYYEMTTPKSQAFLKEYLKEKKLNEDELLKLGFYTRYGGKLVFLPILALMIWGAIPSRKKDEKIEPTKL